MTEGKNVGLAETQKGHEPLMTDGITLSTSEGAGDAEFMRLIYNRMAKSHPVRSNYMMRFFQLINKDYPAGNPKPTGNPKPKELWVEIETSELVEIIGISKETDPQNLSAATAIVYQDEQGGIRHRSLATFTRKFRLVF